MIHILFSASAAGTVRQMLRARGLSQRVVDLSDSLNWGPITGSFSDRETWLDHHAPLSFGARDWIANDVTNFDKMIAADAERLIWIAPRSAAEQSGLYWYLAQYGGANTKMVVADYPLREAWRGQAPFGLGELDQARMAELFDGCASTTWDSARFPEDRWFGLMAEDALLRIVEAGKLRSAPDNFFDDFIWRQSPDRPTKLLHAIGNIMAASFDLENTLGDDFIIWRLRELVLQGKIRCDGGPLQFVADSKSAPMIQRIE